MKAAALLASPTATPAEIEAALEAVVHGDATSEFVKAFGPRRLVKALASGRLTDRAAELADELLSAAGATVGLAPSLEFTDVLHHEELYPDEVIDLSSDPPSTPAAASDEDCRLHLRLGGGSGAAFWPPSGRVVWDAPTEAAAVAIAEAPTLRLANPSRRYRIGSEIECKVWPAAVMLGRWLWQHQQLAIFSVLPTFFPPVAKSKGMSDFVLGVSFAAMPAVVFSVSAIADQIMYAYGRRRIFILGNAITAAFTALLGAATLMPDGAPFAAFCLVSQIGQGFGSALAEASSFALIAELFPRRVTFYFGLNETFTGLGVAIGPPIGGLLFAIGGFWCPFVTLACALLPGIVFIHVALRPSAAEGFKDEVEGVEDDVSEAGSVLTVLRVPGVATIMLACVLAESAITFLMPTFAEHALATGLGTSAPAIGMYFTANALLYTVGAPLVGLFTTPANARRMIVCGMVILSGACFLIGPRLGEGLAMAPLMEDMMVSCGANSSAYLNSLSGLMAASFALGQSGGGPAAALAALFGRLRSGSLFLCGGGRSAPPGNKEVAAVAAPRVRKTLTATHLVGLTFFAVSGGDYGIEDAVGAAGPAWTLLGLLVLPWVWSLPMALMTAELGSMIPDVGGPIIWVQRAFGPLVAHLNAIVHLVAGFFDLALYPVMFADYLREFHPALRLEGLGRYLLSSGMLGAITLLNLAGVEAVAAVSTVFTALVISPFVALAADMTAAIGADATDVVGGGYLAATGVRWGTFLSVMLWNTSGYDSMGAFAAEVENPGRDFPRAMVAAIVLITLVYVLPVAVGVSLDDRASLPSWTDGTFARVAAEQVGPWLARWISLGGAISALGILNSLLCAAARNAVSAADIGALPRVLATVHAPSGTPRLATLSLSLGLLLVISLPFRQLVELSMIFYGATTGLEFFALVRLRSLEPRTPRPYRMPLADGGVLIAFCVPPLALCALLIVLADRLSIYLFVGSLLLGLVTFPLRGGVHGGPPRLAQELF
ncbi:amino acid permease family protein [Chrysochromulina tobinii]|uniref:Amino acid permease family protein n=1 Tax=Chrysochromulina tobinii TaxID=1460289 RepID=A0A0M0J803_9EUKA|nr:amino acid permease family protein [Chrysochromulina tobinii]|eukprot:KOO22731.1 amino acid permease family protein [Chrysochromulina sp. CCMP291]